MWLKAVPARTLDLFLSRVNIAGGSPLSCSSSPPQRPNTAPPFSQGEMNLLVFGVLLIDPLGEIIKSHTLKYALTD